MLYVAFRDAVDALNKTRHLKRVTAQQGAGSCRCGVISGCMWQDGTLYGIEVVNGGGSGLGINISGQELVQVSAVLHTLR